MLRSHTFGASIIIFIIIIFIIIIVITFCPWFQTISSNLILFEPSGREYCAIGTTKKKKNQISSLLHLQSLIAYYVNVYDCTHAQEPQYILMQTCTTSLLASLKPTSQED